MALATKASGKTHNWVDGIAITMAMVCAVHCLLTPVLITLLPLIATTFFVDKYFHLWMLLLVLPTTTFALFMGCRKHKDKIVLGLGTAGLLLLTAAVTYEMLAQGATHHECAHCTAAATDTWPSPTLAFNVFAGLIIAGAHFRNFRLCRKDACKHD